MEIHNSYHMCCTVTRILWVSEPILLHRSTVLSVVLLIPKWKAKLQSQQISLNRISKVGFLSPTYTINPCFWYMVRKKDFSLYLYSTIFQLKNTEKILHLSKSDYKSKH